MAGESTMNEIENELQPIRRALAGIISILCVILLLCPLSGCSETRITEEITFHSGAFRVVGDLTLPEGEGPHPVVVFVHGDGPNNRTSGVTYPPIMERILRAGFATFAWDKPGTGKSTGEIDRSRLLEQRSRIVMDALAVLKKHTSIDERRIGMWGISQAGYVMPTVLSKCDDIAFMIAVSCPGAPGIDQGAYLVTAQAVCAGLSKEDAKEVQFLLTEVERARTYEEYVKYKEKLKAYSILASIKELGLNMEIRQREEWHEPNLDGDYFWDPMGVIERISIPVLAFFGEKDTQADPIQGAQAYRSALEIAGNPHSRVELIEGVDHNLIISKTGSLKERRMRSREGWRNYAPKYLDILEQWLRELNM
jgi:pimeloyl-ACP methyl ester carboxylesterase